MCMIFVDLVGEWIQIDLLDKVTVTGLITQGREGYDQQWVTSYNVYHGDDMENLQAVKDNSGTAMVSKFIYSSYARCEYHHQHFIHLCRTLNKAV